jgi:hypothetical protein
MEEEADARARRARMSRGTSIAVVAHPYDTVGRSLARRRRRTAVGVAICQVSA